MFEDREGNLWFGSNGLYRVTETDDKVSFENIDLHLPEQFIRGLSVVDINQAKDGSLWLTSNYGVIRRLPDNRVIFYPADRAVNQGNISILLDKDGRVWMTRVKEFHVFVPEPIEALTNLEQFTIQPIKPTSVISLNSNEEIKLLQSTGEIIQFTDNDNPLLKNAANKFFQSSDGFIWLTTEKGLYEFNGQRFHFYSSEQGFPQLMVKIAEDAAGNL